MINISVYCGIYPFVWNISLQYSAIFEYNRPRPGGIFPIVVYVYPSCLEYCRYPARRQCGINPFTVEYSRFYEIYSPFKECGEESEDISLVLS